MEKKGQVIFYSIMLGLCIIILSLALAPSVKQFVDTARNDTQYTNFTDEFGNNGTVETIGLNCSSSDISTVNKVACISSDLSIFYVIGIFILIGGAILLGRVIFS
jgi:uncharacterized membrane protein YedE/YeeE